jgi:hypothetical protein
MSIYITVPDYIELLSHLFLVEILLALLLISGSIQNSYRCSWMFSSLVHRAHMSFNSEFISFFLFLKKVVYRTRAASHA